MTNTERRDKGLAYIADADTFKEMAECQKKLKKVNELNRWEIEKITLAVKEVIPDSGSLFVVPPFYCEYGIHIKLGNNKELIDDEAWNIITSSR